MGYPVDKDKALKYLLGLANYDARFDAYLMLEGIKITILTELAIKGPCAILPFLEPYLSSWHHGFGSDFIVRVFSGFGDEYEEVSIDTALKKLRGDDVSSITHLEVVILQDIKRGNLEDFLRIPGIKNADLDAIRELAGIQVERPVKELPLSPSASTAFGGDTFGVGEPSHPLTPLP